MCQTVLKHVVLMKAKRSTLKMGILRKRTERSAADHDVSHESMMVKEADMDFRIAGLPLSFVTHAQSTSVRQLTQKIENHPDRHALQKDLRQNQSFNPLSRIKTNDFIEVGNIELCEFLETEPQNAVHSLLIILEHWVTSLHVRGISCIKKEGPINNNTLDLLSVPEYVIKKGRFHGHRYGKAGRQRIFYG